MQLSINCVTIGHIVINGSKVNQLILVLWSIFEISELVNFIQLNMYVYTWMISFFDWQILSQMVQPDQSKYVIQLLFKLLQKGDEKMCLWSHKAYTHRLIDASTLSTICYGMIFKCVLWSHF